MRLSTIIYSALLAAVIPTAASAQAIEGAPSGYKLVWSDEFDGDKVNEDIWNIEVNNDGGGNRELQYYRRQNVSVEDGKLVLTARRESFGGLSFTSGRVNSKNKTAFKHGIMQAKIKFPKTADGLWPAYWMMGNDMDKVGWPRCGEIDIIEMGHFNAITGAYAGWQDRYFSGTLHYGPSARDEDHQQESQEFTQSRFETMTPIQNDEYHIFTIEWTDDKLYMYYDLEAYTNAKKRTARYFSLDIPASEDKFTPGTYFQKAFFFLFNLAVGGTFPNIYKPDLITALPNAGDEAKMYVDWVRVYQQESDTNAQYLFTDENGEKHTNIPEEPEPEKKTDETTELSGFASEALDANGESTFDFADGYDYVLISTSEGVTGNCLSQSNVLANYNVNNLNRFLYVWSGTYYGTGYNGAINSFGWGEGYNKWTVTSAGWSGLGFAGPYDYVNDEDETVINPGMDLSVLDNDEDDYWLHFGVKGTDVEQHASHTILLGDAQFMIGPSDGKLASVGDYKRDGEWYYFDIPVRAIRQFATPIYNEGTTKKTDPETGAEIASRTYNNKNYVGNAFAIMSGGVEGTELMFDNVFFYRSKSKEVANYIDTSSNLGKYGYKSLDDNGNPAFDIAKATTVVPIALDQTTWESWTGQGTYGADAVVTDAKYDNTEQASKNKFYVWNGFTDKKFDVKNSFGQETWSDGVRGIGHWTSALNTWNGMGFASINALNKDLSMIDDNYYIHFSLRSDAAVAHVPITLTIGGASLTFGSYSVNPIFADFNRDGEWYSFDIPVKVLKQYATDFLPTDGNPVDGKGTLDNYRDYVFNISTGDTHYNNAYFAWNDVFFWTDGTTPEVAELGDYGYKSLDDNGESDFDFDGKEFINFNVASATIDMQTKGNTEEDNILAGYYTLNNWVADYLPEKPSTYEAGTKSGEVANSFGITSQGWIDLVVGNLGWSGGGFISSTGANLMVLEDGDWYLHFAMRGTGTENHLIGFGGVKFTIGSTPFDNNVPVLGNYKRDGEWYSFDIPYSKLKSLGTLYPPFDNGNFNGIQAAWKSNLFWFQSGGVAGTEIQLDNIFFWREKKDDTDGIQVIRNNEVPAVAVPYADAVFDLQGRRVATLSDVQSHRIQLRKGIYVINGKKIVIR